MTQAASARGHTPGPEERRQYERLIEARRRMGMLSPSQRIAPGIERIRLQRMGVEPVPEPAPEPERESPPPAPAVPTDVDASGVDPLAWKAEPVVGVRARMDDLEQALALALIRIANLEEAAMERVPRKQRLKMLLDQERGRAKKIMEEIAKKHGVSMIELTSKRRTRRIVEARFEASYVLKKRTRLSLPQIGRLLGYRDHTAILYAVRAIEKHKEQGAQ